MNGEALGITIKARALGYEDRLFSTDKVHTIDIVMDDEEEFFENAQDEEYTICSIVIDGESMKNVAIRCKGNTSLTNVASYGNNRYSLKIEFDHYDSTKTYHGLDKLCLNNIIQDNTYMKDYLVYTWMNEMGVDAPLCSYAYITINGEDFGLYLAVEAIEDSFLTRNYDSTGNLYKPDSQSMGGGRGEGKNFDMSEQMENFGFSFDDFDSSEEGMTMPDMSNLPESLEQMENFGFSSDDLGGFEEGMTMPDMQGQQIPDMENGQTNSENPPEKPDGDENGNTTSNMPDMSDLQMPDNAGGMGGGMSMGSDDVKLIYSDDNVSSYSNIFDNAKTDPTDTEKQTLIESIKSLNSYENLDKILDTDEVIRYFVVHNFSVNGDSYTGSMIHNYYLYENDGKMSMIPWDYNLAFGGFQGGASSVVNDSIDSPLSTASDERPMWEWIKKSDEYTSTYHTLFSEFLETDFEAQIESTYELIKEYVEKDPTKFCTYDEFTTGVSTLKEFISLRVTACKNQLSGDNTSVSTGSLNLNDMGGMTNTQGGGKQNESMQPKQNNETSSVNSTGNSSATALKTLSSSVDTMPNDGNMQMPQGGSMPDMQNGTPPDMQNGEMPQDGSMPDMQNGEMPEMPQDGSSPDMQNGEMPEMPTIEQTENAENIPTETVSADTDSTTIIAVTTNEATDAQKSEDETASNDRKQGMNGSFGNREEGQTNFNDENNMDNREMPGAGQNSGNSAVYLFIATLIILIAGLIFAILFKRRTI